MNRLAVTRGIVEGLGPAVARPTGAIAPVPTGNQKLTDLMPYVVVKPIDGPPPLPTLANDWDLWEFVYQLRSVGRNEEQAEAMADRARHRWLSWSQYPFVFDGLKEIARDPDTGPQEPVKVDENMTYIDERFIIKLAYS